MASTSGNATPPAPRPRLVAKPLSGQQASAPKTLGSGNKNGSASGPDPNQVWNRNRRMTFILMNGPALTIAT